MSVPGWHFTRMGIFVYSHAPSWFSGLLEVAFGQKPDVRAGRELE